MQILAVKFLKNYHDLVKIETVVHIESSLPVDASFLVVDPQTLGYLVVS